MNACAMVRRCMIHQCPDVLGIGPEPPEGSVPPELRYGRGEEYTPGSVLPEPPMGDPEAIILGA